MHFFVQVGEKEKKTLRVEDKEREKERTILSIISLVKIGFCGFVIVSNILSFLYLPT